ncbi:MAG: glutamate mutase L, partial [Spirochaetaceae bacterium]
VPKAGAGKNKPDPLEWGRFFATSSAAGGLRMTVHGLAYDMTVRAGREAALGAGANLHHVTAGLLRGADIEKIREVNPNIILIAGGVDYGERDTALHNAEKIAELLRGEELTIPVIYAGNVENRGEIEKIFQGLPGRLYTVENVYPRIDDLNVAPARAVIQEVFEEHITGGPGMEHIRELVDGPVMPTPGAVLLAAELLRKELGDLAVLDVGGATTDVHSVTAGSEEVQRILTAPEPEAKRTVEGDLGTYVSRRHILGDKNIDTVATRLGFTKGELEDALEVLPPIPRSEEEVALAEELTRSAARKALLRHAGSYRSLFGPEGKKHVAEGKDLTAVKYLIATGGALTRLPGRGKILREIVESLPAHTLTPPKSVRLAFDAEYIMAAAGVIGREYPEAAAALVKKSLREEESCPDRR